MNGTQLRNSILQYAIQGKLVPQDPNDEPASVLIEHIREEKNKWQKVKNINKDKTESVIYNLNNSYYEKMSDGRTICIDESIPFELPNGWVWERWGNISFSIQYGYNASAQSVGDIRMVRISDIQNNNVNWETVPFCTIKKDEIETYLLKPNDILFARTGGTVGKSFLVENVPVDSIFAGYLIRTRYSEKLVPRYMKFFMESQLYWEQLRNGTIATAQPNCNGKTLSKMFIPIPPKEEQLRIVEKLNQLMPLIESYDKAQQKLDELNKALPDRLRKSILKEAIQGKLVEQDPNDEPASVLLERIREEKQKLVKEGKLKNTALVEKNVTDEEKPYEIPQSWIWCRLSDICIFLSRGKSPKYSTVDKTYPVFAQKCNLKQGGISLEQAQFLDPSTLSKWGEDYKLKTGDVLVNSTGTGTVGRTRLFNESCLGDYPFAVPDSHVSVVRTSENVISEYIYALFSSKTMQTYIEDNLAGSTNQKELYITVLQDMLVPLPPLAEQKRIVAKLDELLKHIK